MVVRGFTPGRMLVVITCVNSRKGTQNLSQGDFVLANKFIKFSFISTFSVSLFYVKNNYLGRIVTLSFRINDNYLVISK